MTADSARFSLLTFNLLAPCYKRMYNGLGNERRERERDYESLWRPRLEAMLQLLLSVQPTPAIINLQEVWFHQPYLARLEAVLSPYYHIFYARRPHKDDGLATLVSKNAALFSDVTHVSTFMLAEPSCKAPCDRVGLAVSAQIVPPDSAQLSVASRLLIVNTHLTFPHSFIPPNYREMQAEVLTSFANNYAKNAPFPVVSIIVGDFNSDSKSSVCQNVTSESFINCFQHLNGDVNPITHFNHRRQSVYVDHVFLRHGRGKERTAPATTCCLKLARTKERYTPSPVSIKDARESVPKLSCAIVPVDSKVYPEHIPHHVWPTEFMVSDHRPVAIEFNRVMAPLWR
ncbi:putative calcium-binding protein [Gracilariopsis chorda]|uniref:Putative calcium-binding protein n=1 Tax=Gracilariopsis chorda TaxID=448386 RepID=A0A2V3J2K9_9FLOR|nr:putative calcium-binding protein [Gracilariopsis chorda]|eukprot:PXF48573.1 putative calcium-binding protein [Gracilariopsis chorda]